MTRTTLRGHPIRQVAYYVPDIRAAALAHTAHFGSGPFFIAEHIPACICRYRGQPGTFDHSSAYGQWGDVMIEFVQVNSSEPSIFTDLFPNGGPGFHHIALIVPDLAAAMQEFEEIGYKEAMYAEVVPGAAYAMMDATHELGHFIELYPPAPSLLSVYHLVESASHGWDGTDNCRSFSLV